MSGFHRWLQQGATVKRPRQCGTQQREFHCVRNTFDLNKDLLCFDFYIDSIYLYYISLYFHIIFPAVGLCVALAVL